MQSYNPRVKNNPEAQIQQAIIDELRRRGWFVKPTHGSMYQSGFPDLWISHKNHGGKWVEVKLPGMKGSRWTAAQRKVFPQMMLNGSPIWILTSAAQSELRKLFEPPNFNYYWILKP